MSYSANAQQYNPYIQGPMDAASQAGLVAASMTTPGMAPAMAGISAAQGVGQLAQGVGGLAGATSALGVLGPIGSAVSGAASLGGTIYGLTQIGQETDAERVARHAWESGSKVATDLAEQLYYMPYIEGTKPLYQAGEDTYNFAPSQAYQNMATSYLNRAYGMPDHIARGFVAQAQAPMMATNLPAQFHPSQLGTSGATPQEMAAVMGAQDQTVLQGQASKLKGASDLAGYNLWRAQQLQSLIG